MRISKYRFRNGAGEGLAEEQAEVKAQLVKLAPAWAELRKVLNELNRVIEG